MAEAQGASRLPAVLIAVPLAALLALVCAAVSIALVFGGEASCSGPPTGTVKGVPAKLVPIYQQAAARYDVGPRGPAILASINEVETDFGRNTSVSSAGAQGWMQFMPATWAAYGVDANEDGRRDPADPWDAIFAAANYLAASGAPDDWHAAIFAYNHAEWYVSEVLAGAERYAGAAGAAVPTAATCGATASNEAVARMVAEAQRLSDMRPHTSYVWGGSHGISPTPANGPFDCSSAVSHLLQVGGFGNPTMDTTALIAWGDPGPGRWVTIHVKPYGADAHTFIEFAAGVTPPAKRYWGTSGIYAGQGPGWIAQEKFSSGYLAGFQLRHPPGL